MKNENNLTIRQQIIECLIKKPMTPREISQSVSITEKDVYFHLAFIEKTVRRKSKTLKTVSYYCLQCGFEFKKRKTFKKPGKCPGCRHPRIQPALFHIIDL